MRRILITVSAGATVVAFATSGAAQAQAPGGGYAPQGQILYNCPPGYICSPAQQPPSAPARQLTPQEIDQVRSAVVNDGQGSILRPGEIGALRDRVLDAQGAANWPGYAGDELPVPTPKVIEIKDAKTRTPDKIILAIGVVTPISFLDKAGRPLAITSVAFDPRTFAQDGIGCDRPAQQQQGAEARPTTVNFMPCRFQTFGNMIFSLENMSTPVVLIAQSGQPGDRGKVDLPVTVRVLTSSSTQTAEKAQISDAERRARALKNAYTTAGATQRGVDPELDSFLTAVVPKGAVSIPTDMQGVSAWEYEGRLYLRGPVTVVAPAYDVMGLGTNGDFVWRFARPIALVRVATGDGAERSIHLGL